MAGSPFLGGQNPSGFRSFHWGCWGPRHAQESNAFCTRHGLEMLEVKAAAVYIIRLHYALCIHVAILYIHNLIPIYIITCILIYTIVA